jgi:hypothetical protein
MKTYTINGMSIELDETVEYVEFFVSDDGDNLYQVDFQSMLSGLESGKEWGESLRDQVRLMSRWIHEAPRKRNYRDLIRRGVTVASAECFFEHDKGIEIIDALERTGHLAAKILFAYGVKPVEPITHNDPITPTSTEEILGG